MLFLVILFISFSSPKPAYKDIYGDICMHAILHHNPYFFLFFSLRNATNEFIGKVEI